MASGIGPITDEIDYPTSDGKPMAETDLHRDLMLELINTLRGYYAGRPDAYVSGNLMVYYERGNRRKFLSPDCMVVFGVPNRMRTLYKTWEEGRFPSVVFELTSKTTDVEDTTEKMRLYRDVWKVDEYFLFDPTEDYLDPRLQGYRRAGDRFDPIEPLEPDVIESRVLGLRLEASGTELFIYEAGTMRLLHTPERQAAIDAEFRRRQAEQAKQRAEQAKHQAEQAKHQAEQAKHQAESNAAAERTAREAAELDNARLRAELAALRQPPKPDA